MAAGEPLLESYTDPRTGRTYQRRRRPLSNDSVNKVFAGVRQVLKEAKRRRLIEHNPLEDREGPVLLKPTIEFDREQQTLAYHVPDLIGIVRSYIPYEDVAVSLQTLNPRIIFEENSGLASVIPMEVVDAVIGAASGASAEMRSGSRGARARRRGSPHS